MISTLKNLCISLLESHPYGYAFGLKVLESSSVFLPHEADFYGIPLATGPLKSGLFLDVGANRGHSALGFNKIMLGGKLVSIEANPIHASGYSILRQAFISDYYINAADAISAER